ncbi:MAG TPA: phosphotransferase, partial [Chloroflexota bacterium]|nr:phosphotransferase [Chloroflexota bacterium]
PTYLGRAASIDNHAIAKLGLGTSGAKLFSVTVRLDKEDRKVELILKVGREDKPTEALFYRDLAGKIPIRTPRVVATGIDDGHGWVLMERVAGVRKHTNWTEADYRNVVEDMALLHSQYWNNTDSLRTDWLRVMNPETVSGMIPELTSAVDELRGSWLAATWSDALGEDRLDRMTSALEASEALARPLRAAGLTFVHGDYWFYNSLHTRHGRRVVVDWQTPMIWSGCWELAYFMNLLRALGRDGYRQIPVPEETIVAWYAQAIAARGVDIEARQFQRALCSGRVLHAMFHWLPQLAGSAEHPKWACSPIFEQAHGFFNDTFDEWDREFAAL